MHPGDLKSYFQARKILHCHFVDSHEIGGLFQKHRVPLDAPIRDILPVEDRPQVGVFISDACVEFLREHIEIGLHSVPRASN